MQMDKKVMDGTVRFVLVRCIGEVIVSGDFDRAQLEATLNTDNLTS